MTLPRGPLVPVWSKIGSLIFKISRSQVTDRRTNNGRMDRLKILCLPPAKTCGRKMQGDPFKMRVDDWILVCNGFNKMQIDLPLHLGNRFVSNWHASWRANFYFHRPSAHWWNRIIGMQVNDVFIVQLVPALVQSHIHTNHYFMTNTTVSC